MLRLLVIVIVIVAACATSAGPDAPPGAVSVERVVDGDSLVLETPDGEMDVRLSGVNAPERGECHHAEAAEALRRLVEVAQVSLTIVGTDQFGRVLGRLEADGSDLALALVREGHGLAVATAPNSYKLLAAEDTAHADGIGMWATDSCGSGSRPHVTFDPGASVTDPAGRDDEELDAEVIVIVNRDDHAVNLTRWVLRDGSSRHRYRFGSGVMLPPGATIQIDSADPGWSPGGGPVWSNEGDIALLLDPRGGIVAHWRYDG